MIKFAAPFNLVCKPDRRQNPDRRSAWRGSRRITDLREFGQGPVAIDGVLDWAPEADSSQEDRLAVKVGKYVH